MPKIKKTASTKIEIDLPGYVDRLASLNSRIDTLKAEADAIKTTLKASGQESIESKRYRCVIVHVPAGEKLDTKLVRQYLTTEQLVECTKYTEPQTRVMLYDR